MVAILYAAVFILLNFRDHKSVIMGVIVCLGIAGVTTLLIKKLSF